MRRIDRYEFRQSLAATGTGEVCVAFDPVIERTVVVKTLDRSLLPSMEAPDLIARFRREAIAAGRLTHPGIVTIYEYGEAGDLCFIAMEHAQGPTLREFLKQGLPPLPVVLAIARQLFAAMIYAHEQGVLHRDLKPSNIVLAGKLEDPSASRAKILDFGIARIYSAAAVTQAGTIMGTPGYMAPEQYRGDATDTRSDIYALGVTLFEMITGSRTFSGKFAEVVDLVLTRDAPLASSLRGGLPAGLDAVLAKALARDPAARFGSMRDFREAFVRAMPAAAVEHAGGQQVAHPTPSPDLVTTFAPAPPDRPRAMGSKARLLLVDDEERILGALSALFRLRYDVITSTDGHKALEMVKTHRPDVIISDQRMPQMPGVEFLRRAREIDPSSVRILLTGYSDLAAIVGSINDGEVFRFVNKPWSNQDLRDTVAQAVDIARSSRASGALQADVPTIVEASPQKRAGEAIVVAQPGRELFDLVNEAFGRTRPVCHAVDMASALQAVEDEEVAVLLCDLDALSGADVMLKMLKQSHPKVQSVALANHSDADGLISLINEAQILRFLNKPVKMGLLERALRSALAVHANYKSAPVLVQRQAVKVREEVSRSSLGQQILQRLSLLVRPRAVA